ncbi:carboxypeptidase-like regulatory domain-containing protein [Aquipuribacter hungaricus]|uniref:Carboxypeptidase-like regulatory domain-containing protein n=1 Tax=Aquipuribacter hungaricus TaxID=545624 RepID=A0ABV7WMJ1_9MICO
MAFPPDGWYLTLYASGGTTDEQRHEAEALLTAARAAGYDAARIFPATGSPSLCMGKPCIGTGPAPGENTAVVLAGFEGPDFTTTESSEVIDDFYRTVADPAKKTASDAGLTASVHWLSFSQLTPGALTGRLLLVGGPAGSTPVPLSGDISWRSTDGGGSGTLPTDPEGHYTAKLPPGRYELTGRSPHYNDGSSDCSAEAPITVTVGGTVTADIACPMR